MASDFDIRDKINIAVDTFRDRPDTRCSTSILTGRIEDGLRCVVREDDHRGVMDMAPEVGGAGGQPRPGFYARAGIAGCLAINIKMAAARSGLDLSSVEVEIATEFDDSAMFGVGDNTAGPLAVRVALHVETSEDEDQVERLIHEAVSRDPWFLALRDAQSVTFQTEIVKP